MSIDATGLVGLQWPDLTNGSVRMFLIPDLSRTSFTDVEVELTASPYEFEPSIAAKLDEAFSGERLNFNAEDTVTFSRSCRLTFKDLGMAGSQFTAQLGLHIAPLEAHIPQADKSLANALQGGVLISGGKEIHLAPTERKQEPQEGATEFAELVGKTLAPLYGLKLSVGSEYKFRVAVSELPPGGIVARGLGALARFGEDVLRLAGAQFVINPDNEDDSRLSWFLDLDNLPRDWELIQGSLQWIGDVEIGPTFLRDLVDFSQARFDRYVLDSLTATPK